MEKTIPNGDRSSIMISAKQQILDLSRQHFEENFQHTKFKPRETHIPATAKNVDYIDLCQLIEASLDMHLTGGRFTAEFERGFADLFDRSTSALFVNSGSSANLLALSALGLEKGDEVITAAAAFPTTVNPIIQNGLTPVFVDVDLETLNVTTESVMAAKTDKTKAVMLAHTLGNPFRADILREWCDNEGLYLIEDCCDALGSYIGKEKAGSFGDYSTFSFYPAHHITTGEGGAVLSKNGKFRKTAESFRDWGRDCWCDPGKDNTCKKRFCQQFGELPDGYDHKYVYSNIGYNLKTLDHAAAIGISQLRKLPSFSICRHLNYSNLLKGIREDNLLSESFYPIKATQGTFPNWFGFPILCANHIERNQVIEHLERRKIGTRLVFSGNITKQPAYLGQNYRIHGELKNTDKIMEKCFWIGIHPGITKEHTDYMLQCLKEAV